MSLVNTEVQPFNATAFHDSGAYEDLLKLLPTGTAALDREPWASGR